MVVTPRWFISLHALGRMAEMEVTRAEVIAVVEDPEVTYNSDPRRHPDGSRVARRGKLLVAYWPERREIITVLWADDDFHDRSPCLGILRAGTVQVEAEGLPRKDR